jgi:hypothetical protein
MVNASVVPLTCSPSPVLKGPSVASRRSPLIALRLVTVKSRRAKKRATSVTASIEGLL